jgi:hypothetical protein
MYYLLFILAIFCNAVMDADALDAFGRWAEKRYNANPTKFNKILWDWVDVSGWENKYKIQDWLIKHDYQPWVAKWLAQDVLVIFLDLWHFAKAIMMICFEIPLAILIASQITIIPVWLILTILFLGGGVLFNFFYYRLRKI